MAAPGSSGRGFDQPSRTGSVTCQFPDGPASTSVTATVSDDDGASDNDYQNVTVTVDNVTPTVTAAADQTADEGVSSSIMLGSFTDPGDDSPWT